MASSQAAMLANVLHRVRLMEESQSRSTAMLNKLRLEMEDVASRLHKLDFSHKSAFREINSLLERFGEQMAVSREKEQEKARVAFLHLRGEMEEERNACSVLKMRNKKLTKDLTHANVAAADTCKELGRERKARELLEEVCNELAREIGEDKVEVEKLKQEQEESRERLEEELKMLRMAALWREEGARSKLFELELDDDKRGMPLQELEACANTVEDACEGSQEEIEKQAKEAECLTQALERASSKDENQLDGDEGKLLHGDRDTMNGIEHRMSVNETRRPHSGRRRWRANGQQRHNVGNRPHMRIYDQKNSILETHCENLAWSSSEDVPDKLQLITLPLWGKGGHVVEGEDNANSEVANKNGMRHASSGYGRHTILPEMRPSVFATSNVHIKQKECCHLEQSLCSPVVKGSHRTHCLSARFEGGAGGEVDGKLGTEMGTSIRYSFSEDDAPSYIGSRGERRRKQGPLDGLNMSVTGQNEQASHNAVRDDHHHRHLDVHKSTGTVEAGAEDSELDDFYFEPVRAPPNASTNNINCKANEDEHAGNDTTRVERGVSNCSDEARCGIMAKYSQARKESKDRAHERAESISILDGQELSNIQRTASHSQARKESKDRAHERAERISILDGQELSNIQGSASHSQARKESKDRAHARAESISILDGQELSDIQGSVSQETMHKTSGRQETMNKVSSWRSASAKLRPHFWPLSPNAFSILGEAKKCSKTRSSTPGRVAGDEQHMKCSGSPHSHVHRQASPAKEAIHQQQLVCIKSDSLGAQLINGREPENEKRTFRFSPLRRAISRG